MAGLTLYLLDTNIFLELLLDQKELELIYRLRRVLSELNPVEAVELLKSRLAKCKTNAEFLMSMKLD